MRPEFREENVSSVVIEFYSRMADWEVCANRNREAAMAGEISLAEYKNLNLTALLGIEAAFLHSSVKLRRSSEGIFYESPPGYDIQANASTVEKVLLDAQGCRAYVDVREHEGLNRCHRYSLCLQKNCWRFCSRQIELESGNLGGMLLLDIVLNVAERQSSRSIGIENVMLAEKQQRGVTAAHLPTAGCSALGATGWIRQPLASSARGRNVSGVGTSAAAGVCRINHRGRGWSMCL